MAELPIDMEKTQHEQIMAEIAKLMAETAKINNETRWYEVVVITAMVVSIITITKLFL